jgi:2-desacetyl-2-hydroxyethyl bacteriochlorophyllide A dehydrogenase
LRAAVADAIPTGELRVADGLRSPQGDADAVVNVEACGICGTDLHILAGGSYKPATPFVLGHEPVGRLTGDVPERGLRAGQLVTMTIFEGCGHCEYCLEGDERLCQQLRSIVGVDRRWGGFAERLAIPRAQLVAVPDVLSADVAASLVDAGATAANAARAINQCESSGVVVLGGGPVGLLTAEIARHDGRAPTVIEPNALRRRELEARSFETESSITRLLHRDAIDCIVDCVGVPDVVGPALELLRPHGTLVVVGYAMMNVDFSFISRKELRVVGIRSGNRKDLERALGLVSAGSIQAPPIQSFRLDEINEAFRALRAGELDGKAVINSAR